MTLKIIKERLNAFKDYVYKEVLLIDDWKALFRVSRNFIKWVYFGTFKEGLKQKPFGKKTGLKIVDWTVFHFRLLTHWWDKYLETPIFFKGKPYGTNAGIRVRSPEERIVAEFLYENHIKFEYERPLRLGNFTLYPDFYLPDKETYIEFWGPIDSNENYKKKMKDKKKLYEAHGINLISVYPITLETNEKGRKGKRGLKEALSEVM